VPVEIGTSVQLPELGCPGIVAVNDATVQLKPAPSLTCTLPDGLIDTPLAGVTVTFARICWPTTADAVLKAKLRVVVPLFNTSVVVPELAL